METIKKVGMSSAQYWRPVQPQFPEPQWVRRNKPVPMHVVSTENIDVLVKKLEVIDKLKQD